MDAPIDPVAEAWQDAADANVEHDLLQEQRACARLVELHELLPAPREPSE
jgi:hypothetical protein